MDIIKKLIQDNISVIDSLPNIDDYWDLFQTTGWNDEYNFTKQDLACANENCWYSISLYDSSKLIGFGRVISDGVHHAFIVDLIIHPVYQGRGFGSILLDKLVSKCMVYKIRDVQLFAAKDKYAFYEKFGFEKRTINAPGMQLKQK
jgi:ribosomal protein S18 acetylase RimI-like enzyme